MTNPITPPPDLVQEWIKEPQYMTEDQLGKRMNLISMNEVKFREIIDKISQYSADQELEACLGEIRDGAGRIYIDETRLRVLLAEDIWTARRPKPPSLKEQALEALEALPTPAGQVTADRLDTIRRAIEQLPD